MKNLPNNVDAERSLISACLNDFMPDEIFDVVCYQDFYSGRNRLVFAAIFSMWKTKQPVDIATLSGELRSNGKYDDAGGIQELMEILESAPVAVNPVQYARIIKATSVARDMISAANRISTEAMNANSDNIEELLDIAQAEILGVKYSSTERTCTPFAELISHRVDDYEAMGGGKPVGVKTGFKTVDHATGGLWGSKLVIIAARPGIGKTAFMLNMAKNMAEADHNVGIFELEMDKEELIDRLMACSTSIPSIRLATGNIYAEEWEKIDIAASGMYRYRINIDDTGGLVIADLKRRARSMVNDGAEIIFIDQLSKIRGGKGKSEYEQRSYIVNELMVLKKELKIPVVLLAQINRNADNRSSSKPALSDLKSTGSLEEDSDIVLIGHRPYPYTKKDEDKDIAFWEIAKHRGGLTWNIEMKWDAKTTTFYEI